LVKNRKFVLELYFCKYNKQKFENFAVTPTTEPPEAEKKVVSDSTRASKKKCTMLQHDK